MPQSPSPSPSPTSSPSPKSLSPNHEGLSISIQASSENPTDAGELDTVARPKLSFAGLATSASPQDGRRASIQFASGTGTTVGTASSKPTALVSRRRLSSPPPPSSQNTLFPFLTAQNAPPCHASRPFSSSKIKRVDSNTTICHKESQANDSTLSHFFKLHPEHPAAYRTKNKMLNCFADGSTYESRVSFDTFDNKDATDISFTLVSKHKDYAYSRRSRTFLCGTDQNDYSEFALEWLVEELVEDGDEIVCLRVVDKDSKISSNVSVEQGIYKTEARKLLEHIQDKNEEDKAISLVLEFAVGKVPETIQRMIKIYAPACLIVGTRGKSLGGIQSLLPGSVSKYCLQNSPVPVVVVRPEEKREKKKKKRLADPSRQKYSSILDQRNASGGGAFEGLAQQSGGEASENEAAAVAKAIGLNGGFNAWKGFKKEGEDGSPLTTNLSGRSDATSEAESPSPTGPLMDDYTLEDMPEIDTLGNLVSGDVGQEWEEAGDEQSAEIKVSDPNNDRTPTGPEEAEVGEGKRNQG